MSGDYSGPEIVKEASFSIQTSSGYRLLDRTSSYIWAKEGEDVTLSVKASVDDGYSLKYKWERNSGNGNGNVTELGTEASYKISGLKEEDFGAYDDSVTDTSWSYRVTVSVCKDGETDPVDTYVYYTDLYQESEDFDIICEDEEKTVYKGEDAKFSVNYSEKAGYTIEPQWYVTVASTRGSETDEGFVSADSEFVTPEYDYYNDLWTDEMDENGNWIYERTYYKEVVESDALVLSADKKTLTVKDAANPGEYLGVVDVYKDAEKEEDRIHWMHCEGKKSVNEKTDLVAFMKSAESIEAVEGENAKFIVNAANFNTTKCPITYTWEKILHRLEILSQ